MLGFASDGAPQSESLDRSGGASSVWKPHADGQHASSQAEQSKPCSIHPSSESCTMAPDGSVDVYIACAPCQPYSGLRADDTPVHEHIGFGVLFGREGSVLSQVRRLLPLVFVTEQVTRFNVCPKGASESPKDAFVREALAITRPDGSPHFSSYVMFCMDSGLFLEGSRPRFLGRGLCACQPFRVPQHVKSSKDFRDHVDGLSLRFVT